jgi:hypothetical protein
MGQKDEFCHSLEYDQNFYTEEVKKKFKGKDGCSWWSGSNGSAPASKCEAPSSNTRTTKKKMDIN